MWARTFDTNLLLCSEMKTIEFNASHFIYKACGKQFILRLQGSKAGAGPLVAHFNLSEPALD